MEKTEVIHLARPKETINPEIGKRLKLVRNNLNMTQEQFAEIFNKTEQTIRNWESGRRKVPLEVLERMSKDLKISMEFLKGQEDDPFYTKPDFSKYDELFKKEKVAEHLALYKTISDLGYDFLHIPNTNTHKAQEEISNAYEEIEKFIKFKYDFLYNKYSDNSSN